MSSIIKSSTVIHKLLQERFAELDLNPHIVAEEARKFKVPIFKQQIYTYLSDPDKPKGLTEDGIVWLCIRYGISISLQVKKVPYNEVEAIKRVKEIFT